MPYKRLQRWHFFHRTTGSLLNLTLSRTLKPGVYRLYWKATSDATHEVIRQITPLRVTAKTAPAHAAKPAQIVVVSNATRTVQNAFPEVKGGRVQQSSADEAFVYATYHDVSVFVVDASTTRLGVVRSLHRVFPTATVVVASKSGATRAAAAKAGAVAVPPAGVSAAVAQALKKR